MTEYRKTDAYWPPQWPPRRPEEILAEIIREAVTKEQAETAKAKKRIVELEDAIKSIMLNWGNAKLAAKIADEAIKR
jgi:hypothetical protein